jgi:hypothetical protein
MDRKIIWTEKASSDIRGDRSQNSPPSPRFSYVSGFLIGG